MPQSGLQTDASRRASRAPGPVSTPMRTADSHSSRKERRRNLAERSARDDCPALDRPELPQLNRAVTSPGSSLAQDRQVEIAKPRRIGEDVDFDNLLVPDCEAHDGKRPSIWEPRNDPHGSVHQCLLYELGML
jgi:hypothetical protein